MESLSGNLIGYPSVSQKHWPELLKLLVEECVGGNGENFSENCYIGFLMCLILKRNLITENCSSNLLGRNLNVAACIPSVFCCTREKKKTYHSWCLFTEKL